MRLMITRLTQVRPAVLGVALVYGLHEFIALRRAQSVAAKY